jgi:hypothetical protein
MGWASQGWCLRGDLSYDVKPRLWFSLDGNLWFGGVTSLSGIQNLKTQQTGSRVGVTGSYRVSKHQSLKLQDPFPKLGCNTLGALENRAYLHISLLQCVASESRPDAAHFSAGSAQRCSSLLDANHAYVLRNDGRGGGGENRSHCRRIEGPRALAPSPESCWGTTLFDGKRAASVPVVRIMRNYVRNLSK